MNKFEEVDIFKALSVLNESKYTMIVRFIGEDIEWLWGKIKIKDRKICYPLEFLVALFDTYEEADDYMMKNFRDQKSLDELYVAIYKNGEFLGEHT